MQAETAHCRPLVSVVIITYNQEHCIDRAIAGAVHQRGEFDLEVIVANDASTDGTLARIVHWQRMYPQTIKIIDHQKNQGLNRNYLSAFKAATGDYLCVCDADDYWTSPHKIARQTAYMQKHPECAITFHRVVNHYESTGEKSLSNGKQRPDTTIEHLSRSNYITNLSVMYRRRLVPTESIPEWMAETSLPDYAYHMLYASHGTIHYFNSPMGLYTQNAAGTWSQNGETKRLEMALNVRQHLMSHLGTDSEAYPGLRNAAADILVALIDIARSNSDADAENRYFAALDELHPQAALEIDARLAKRHAYYKRQRGRNLRNTAKRIIRLVSRLIPTPKPC